VYLAFFTEMRKRGFVNSKLQCTLREREALDFIYAKRVRLAPDFLIEKLVGFPLSNLDFHNFNREDLAMRFTMSAAFFRGNQASIPLVSRMCSSAIIL
jgi:hypothetical protein